MPGLVVGIVLGVLYAVLLPPATFDPNNPGALVVSASARLLRSLLFGILSVIGTIVTISYTTGMAGAAWRRGTATLADGATAFQRDGSNVFTAMLALFITGIIAVLLAVPTLGLTLLAYLFLFLYTMPAAVIGEHAGFGALSESYRIATRRFAPTLIVAIAIVVIGLLAGVVCTLLGFAPFIGPMVSAIIMEAVNAYFMLVIVGEYLNLRAVAPAPRSSTTF